MIYWIFLKCYIIKKTGLLRTLRIVFRPSHHTIQVLGGDMASTWVANLWVHAEGQITSLNQL